MGIIPFKKRLKLRLGDIIYKKKMGKSQNRGFRVLVYHSITDSLIENDWQENNTPKELFDRQMQYLMDNEYNVISCRQTVEYLMHRSNIPPKAVSITFDDGYRNNYINALPILKKYNFCATLFLTVNLLENSASDKRYLSRAEVADIIKTGLVDFGSHGLSHRALTILDSQEIDKEVRVSKQRLEDILNAKIDLFTYPFGHSGSYNRLAIAAIESAGYSGAYTTISGINDFRVNPFLMRRSRISWLGGLREFKKHLCGAYDWPILYERFRYKRYE